MVPAIALFAPGAVTNANSSKARNSLANGIEGGHSGLKAHHHRDPISRRLADLPSSNVFLASMGISFSELSSIRDLQFGSRLQLCVSQVAAVFDDRGGAVYRYNKPPPQFPQGALSFSWRLGLAPLPARMAPRSMGCFERASRSGA